MINIRKFKKFDFDIDNDIWDKISVGECFELDWDTSEGQGKISACRTSENDIVFTGTVGGEKFSATLRRTRR